MLFNCMRTLGEVFMRLLCLFGFHRRARNKVRHDGDNLTGRCKWCGIALKKLDDKWVVSEPSA